MRWSLLGVALLLAVGPARAAPDDKSDKKDLTPAQEVEKLTADYSKAQQDFYEKYGKAKTDEERAKLADEAMPKPGPVAERLLELAEKNPADKGVNPKALDWVVRNAGFGGDAAKQKDRALDLLARDHAADDRVGDLCLALARTPSAAAEKFMRAVAEKNPKDEAKGKATLALGQYLKYTAESVREMKKDPEVAKRVEAMAGKETADKLASADPDQMEKEAEKQLQTAADKYADVAVYNSTVGAFAKGELFEVKNLQIGMVAPEIEGEDLNGKPLKLSDYHGKVVVLDFWGNW
jgi:hypothetical protein